MKPEHSPLAERLIRMAERPDDFSKTELLGAVHAILSNCISETQRANDILSRTNAALDYSINRIAQLENELASAQREADHWRALAAGATANSARLQ
ncbi:MAG: hypothetical protein PHT19_08265 [Methylococcus sp.]|nr:hypothetical protein [Methylococcus sp.]